MISKSYRNVDEVLYETRLPNGMKVVILPKPGFRKKSVSLMVPFGSIHTQFQHNFTKEVLQFPLGIHHFLEHMLFESPDRDITRKFSEANASVNAYTASNRTVYFFSTTDDLEKPLTHLLEMVYFPTFEDSLIDKEQQIILQEHQMYQDDPDQQMYYTFMRSLYENHPIRFETLGTEASIQAINAAHLQLAYEIGYHPSTMTLLVVGDVQLDEMESMLGGYPYLNHIPKPLEYTPLLHQETVQIAVPKQVISVDTAIPYVDLGWKLPQEWLQDPTQKAALEISLNFLIEMLFGRQSDVYHKLLQKQWMNENFEYYVLIEEDYGYIRFHLETNVPHALIQELSSILQSIDINTIPEKLFSANRNRLIGSYFRIFNRIDSLASFFTDVLIKGFDVDLLMERAVHIEKSLFQPYVEWLKTATRCELIFSNSAENKGSSE